MICRTSGVIEGPEAVIDSMRKLAHPNLTMTQLKRVSRRMIRSGYLVKRGEGIAPCDTKRRIVTTRDRDDSWVDSKGRIRGGWNGWLAQDLIEGLVPLKPRPPKVKTDKEVCDVC